MCRQISQTISKAQVHVPEMSSVPSTVGSFATASCTNCRHKVTADAIREDILNQVQGIQFFLTVYVE